MNIIIILLSLIVVCVALALIFGLVLHKSDEPPFAITVSVAFVSFLVLSGCGIRCIYINEPTRVATLKYQLKETIKLYEFDKKILESYHPINEEIGDKLTNDITFEVVATNEYYKMVKDYNSKVYEFKCDVKSHQYDRNNPWVSWFCSPAYSVITDEMLENLEYSVGRSN